jgi:tetratricopeptide (TPR) repeat protein
MLDVIFEQRIYLPAAFLVPGLIAPIFMLRLTARRWTVVRLVLMVGVAASAWQTVERNEQWARPSRLWADDLAEAKPARAAANASAAALATRRSDAVVRVNEQAAEKAGKAEPGLGQKLNTARAHMVQGGFARAVALTGAVLEQAPKFSRAAYLHTINLIQLGRIEEARALIRRFVARQRDDLLTVQLLAYLNAETGQLEAAVKRLRQWLDSNEDQPVPRRMTAKNQLAISVERAGRPGEAASIYREITRVDPQNWTAWIQLAKLYRAGGSTEEAEAIIKYLRARNVKIGATDQASTATPRASP